MRNREQYQAVMGKRRWLRSQEAYSEPARPGSKVAVMVPYVADLVQDPRDSQENFQYQADGLAEYYTRLGRKPVAFMAATIEDFQDVLTDRSYPTMVVTGFGSFAAIALPFSKDRDQDPRFGHFGWGNLAHWADHLKTDRFVMGQCTGYNADFNPPLGAGVVSDFRNLRADAGELRFADDIEGLIKIINTPVPEFTEESMTYEQVKTIFRVQRRWNLPVNDDFYVKLRNEYNQRINPTMPVYENKVPVGFPAEVGRYRQYASH